MKTMNATHTTVSDNVGNRRNNFVYTRGSHAPSDIAATQSNIGFIFSERCIGCSAEDSEKFYATFTRDSNILPRSDFTLPMFFNWYDNLSCTDTSIVSRRRGSTRWQYIRYGNGRGNGLGNTICINGYGNNKTDMFYDIVRKLYSPVVVQMDSGLTPDGTQDLREEIQTTTVIAAAHDDELLQQTSSDPLVEQLCNSSLDFTMPTLTNRFEILKQGTIRVGTPFTEDVILPHDLFSLRGDKSANLTLFSDFIYSKMELEIKMMITAPKFGQGKVIASWFPDPVDNIQRMFSDASSLLMRPHVIMDLNTGNAITIRVPQQIRRGMMRNVQHESSNPAVAYASMACLQIRELSPYLTGQDQPLEIPYTIFYRFTNVKLAGISYPVIMQGIDIMPLVETVAPEIKIAERVLKQIGVLNNRDKPIMDNIQRFVPSPRLNFSSGVGVSDSIPLTYDHKSTITILDEYVNPEDPVSVDQLAGRWGLHGVFQWSNQNKIGDMLYRTRALPIKNNFQATTDSEGKTYQYFLTRPTPVAMASSMFAFFRGSLDFRFTFVGTTFHTGVLQVTVSYGRLPEDVDQSESSYTYNFDLGEQREFDVNVPYIYDTPLRRTNTRIHGMPHHLGNIVTPGFSQSSTMVNSIVTADLPLSIEMMTNTFITVRVLNVLTPIANVSAISNLLVYIRGGEDFQLVSPVPTMYNRISDFERSIIMKPFPSYDVVKDRGLGTTDPAYNLTFDYVIPQAIFGNEVNGGSFHSTDTDTRFKTLMRRNVKRMEIDVEPTKYVDQNYHYRWDTQFVTSGRSYYMIPVYIPNHLVRDIASDRMLSSPHSAISTMFRHWRGSIQFTVIVEDQPDGACPVYVSYIPNMGTLMHGTHTTASYLSKVGDVQVDYPLFADCDFSSMGFATEVLLPGVNPSISITAPFDCAHNQCVNTTRYEKTDEKKIFMARDDVTLHSGHIALFSRKKTTLSIFTSIGDDFELSNFIGTPEYKFSTIYTLFDDLVRDKDGNVTGTTKPPSTANPGATVRKSTTSAGGAIARGVQRTINKTARIVTNVETNNYETYRELKRNVEQEQRKLEEFKDKVAQKEREINQATRSVESERGFLAQIQNQKIAQQEEYENVERMVKTARADLERVQTEIRSAERQRNNIFTTQPRNSVQTTPPRINSNLLNNRNQRRPGRSVSDEEIVDIRDVIIPQMGEPEEIPKKPNKFASLLTMGRNVKAISKVGDELNETADRIAEDISIATDTATQVLTTVGAQVVNATGMMSDFKEDFHNTALSMRSTMEHMSGVAEKSGGAIDKMATTFDKNLSVIADNSTRVSDRVDSVVETITKIVQPFADSLVKSIPKNLQPLGLSKVILDTLIDIYTLIRHFEWDTFALHIIRFIANVYNIAIGSIIQYVGKLVEVCKQNFGEADVVVPNAPDGARDASSLVGFFTSVLATGFKYKIDKPRLVKNNISASEFVFDNKTVGFANGTFLWFERCFRAILAAGKWILDKISPPAETAIERLKKKNEFMATVLDEIDDLMNPMNQKILQRSDNIIKIWKNYMVAKAVYKDFALLGSTQAATVIIGQLTKYIRWVEESWSRISACPVRLEPYVMCFSGPSNCGKSYAATSIASELMREIGVQMIGGNPVYTRSPGKNFWDAYNEQEVVLFDDWMNLTDPTQIAEQLRDLFELKSPADFMPEKASINEKGVKANPRLVMLVTNQPFPPHVKNAVATPEAVWRRRDLLIFVRPKTDIVGGNHIRSLDTKLTREFEHLEYAIGVSTDETITDQSPSLVWLDHKTMMRELKTRFVVFTNRERELAKEKLKWFTQDLPQSIQDISNPMDIFYFKKTVVDEKYNNFADTRLPSYLIDRQVNMLCDRLDDLLRVKSQGPGANFLKKTRSKVQLTQLPQLIATPDVILMQHMEHSPRFTPGDITVIQMAMKNGGFYRMNCENKIISEKYVYCQCTVCMNTFVARTLAQRRPVELAVYDCTDEEYQTCREEMYLLPILNVNCPFRCGFVEHSFGYEIWESPKCKNCCGYYLSNTPEVADKMPIDIALESVRTALNPLSLLVNVNGELSNLYNEEFASMWEVEIGSIGSFVTRHARNAAHGWFFVYGNELGWFTTEHVFYQVGDTEYRHFEEVLELPLETSIAVKYCTHQYMEWSVKYGCYVTAQPVEGPYLTKYSYLGVIQQQYIYEDGYVFGPPTECDRPSEYLKQIGVKSAAIEPIITDGALARTIIEQIERHRFEAEMSEQTHCLLSESLGLPDGDDFVKTMDIDFGVASVKIDLALYHDEKMKVRKRFFVCDHCGSNKIIQYGNAKHHICHACYKGKSRCDYCTIYYSEGLMKWYRPALLHYFRELFAVCKEKARKFLCDVFKKCTFVYSFSDVGTCASSLINPNRMQSGTVINDTAKFSKDMDVVLSMKTEVPACQHEKLLIENEPGYTHGMWVVDCDRIPVGMCSKNCWLGTTTNQKQYRSYCLSYRNRFAERTAALIQLADEASGESRDSIMAGIPLFCRPTILPFTWVGDEFTKKTGKGWLVKLQTCWNNSLMFIGVNPTAARLKVLIKCVVSLLGGLTAMAGIWKITKYAFGGSTSGQSSDRGMNHFTSKFRQAKKLPVFKTTTKSQSSEGFEDALCDKLTKNTLLIVLSNGSKRIILRGMGFCGRLAVIPKHYYEKMKQTVGTDFAIGLQRPAHFSDAIEYVFDDVDFELAEDTDLAVFKVPKSLNLFKDIRSLMASKEDLEGRLPTDCELYIPTDGTSVPRIRNVKCAGWQDVKIEGIGVVAGCIRYNHSKQGDCGSLLIRPNTTRPITAMHVAGSTVTFLSERGFGVPLYGQMFDGMESITNLKPLADDYISTIDGAKMHFPDGVVLQSLTVSEVGAYSNIHTKLRKSRIFRYNGEEPTKRPAFLSHREDGYPHDISPLVAGVAKHGKLTRNFKTSEVDEVGKALYDAKYMPMKPLIAEPTRLSIGRAISSLNNTGYRVPLDLTTSVGFPFALTDKKQKCDYIHCKNPTESDFEKRVYEVKGELVQHLVETEALRREGVVPFLPYIDCLKDELKDLEKRKKLGGTRVFCVAPISTTLADRQNFMHFTCAYMQNRLSLQHGVGMSMDGEEWGLLANWLLDMGDNIVCLDYSNFGPGYNAMVNARGNQIIADWTMKYVTGVSKNEIDVLCEEHYNSLHMATNLVYRQLSGGPSGSALTVVRNGLVNELYLLLAWKSLYPGREDGVTNSMYTDFFKYVRPVTYGDDLIMSVHDEAIEWYNGKTIAAFFAKYNIVATDADKTKEMVECKPLSQATFLKRGFVPHPIHHREWLAPLDFNSIKEIPNWIRNSDDDGDATWENAKQAVCSMYGHGETEFNKFRELVNQALAEVGLKTVLDTWRELDKMFFKKHYLIDI